MAPKKFWSRSIFKPKICLDSKSFWIKVFVNQNFEDQKIFLTQNSLNRKFLSLKKIRINFFWNWHFFEPKKIFKKQIFFTQIFWTLNRFGPKFSFDPNLFSTQTFFYKRFFYPKFSPNIFWIKNFGTKKVKIIISFLSKFLGYILIASWKLH